MSTPNTIAIICDFDDTLGDDTTNLLLKEKLGMNEEEISSFWMQCMHAFLYDLNKLPKILCYLSDSPKHFAWSDMINSSPLT